MQDSTDIINRRIEYLRKVIEEKEKIIQSLNPSDTTGKDISSDIVDSVLSINISSSPLMESNEAPFVEWFTKAKDNFPFPSQSTNVWKEECAYCFASPFKTNNNTDGLYINIMSNFQSFCSKHINIDRHRTGCVLYIWQQFERVRKQGASDEAEKNDDKPITKLAIGMEGGFEAPSRIGEIIVKKFGLTIWTTPEATKPDHFLLFPERKSSASSSIDDISVDIPSLIPPKLSKSIEEVIKRDDATRVKEVQAWSAEEEIKPISKYAEALLQIDNPPKISPDPSTWRCADSGMKENLWLNLSTGYIGSGRRNWDGTGGTGAALRHYEETGGLYPLVVKLGTITPKMDQVEVYSYAPDEDCAVIDPHLAKRLAHFGINVNDMRKTDKTLIEMEIDLNNSYDWSRISEEGKKLEPVKGPEHVGLVNLGNSCYCNSVYQVLFSLDSFKKRYLLDISKSLSNEQKRFHFYEASANKEPQRDLTIQMLKLADAFALGDSDYVAPKMLKLLLGERHPDFSTREQQDAAEYFEHMVDRIQTEEKNGDEDPTKLFKFAIESRYQCQQSLQVAYKYAVQNILKVRIPPALLEHAASTSSVVTSEFASASDDSTAPKRQKIVEPVISFMDCLKASIGAFGEAMEEIDDFLSPATKQKGIALKTSKFANFPKYLVCQIQRYVIGPDWTPQKLECLVDVPMEFELNAYFFRGQGPQDGEVTFSETELNKKAPAPASASGNAGASSDEVQPSEEVVGLLMSMGFTPNAAKRAAIATKNNADQAAEWLMNHMDDADINDPIIPKSSSSSSSKSNEKKVDPAALEMLTAMGFDAKSAEFALKQSNGNLDQAAEWLMTHDPTEIYSLMHKEQMKAAQEESNSSNSNSANKSESFNDEVSELVTANDGVGKYRLKGFVSHVGKSTSGGHYVCHILKNGKWIWFNDEKVVVSEQIPSNLGYLYFFERIDESLS